MLYATRFAPYDLSGIIRALWSR